MTACIWVVAEDSGERRRVVSELAERGHRVIALRSAAEALERAGDGVPQLLLTDLGLADIDGIEFVQRMKRGSGLLRVIAICDSRSVERIVEAFDAGADDCVQRPFCLAELQARVRAALRRPAASADVEYVEINGLCIDRGAHRVTARGRAIELAPTEYRLLEFLMLNPDRVFSRIDLLRRVWGTDAHVGPRTVDVHVRRLRKALEPCSLAQLLETVRGFGYRLRARAESAGVGRALHPSPTLRLPSR
jgi:two-component system, OmpR family, phosphate regulon response regulator PhoB